MKFAMGAGTLTHLSKQTSSAHDDLGSVVRKLAIAAEPLEKKFNGNARAVFNQFKARTDQIAVDLNSALSAVLEGIQGQDAAYLQGEQQMVDATSSAQAGVSFDAARFSAR